MNTLLITCGVCAEQVHVGADQLERPLQCQKCGGLLEPKLPQKQASSFVVFDLETTGLSPFAHDIIQIAGCRLRNGILREAEFFATYVNPGGADSRLCGVLETLDRPTA